MLQHQTADILLITLGYGVTILASVGLRKPLPLKVVIPAEGLVDVGVKGQLVKLE
jgi:hypothetical protein